MAEKKKKHVQKVKPWGWILTIALTLLSVLWVMPIFEVIINSFKSNTAISLNTFALPNSETFVGFENYINGMTQGNYNFGQAVFYSFFISIVSTFLILLCTSMAAWYIARVNSKFGNFVYYLCIFSMIVPFQMVQYTLSTTADMLKLNTPYTIPIIYKIQSLSLHIYIAYDINCKETNMIPLNEISYSKLSIPILD